jgi:lipopolysaccharide/colanic/teichoic acid biosynthesis glycosyltransferase
MDITTIQSNETRNKGAYVFLYLSDTSGQWVAYGLSAYALRLHVKEQGFDSLRAYATEMKMPCTVVSHKTVKSLRYELKIIDEVENEMVAFELSREVDYEKYLMWTDKLNHEDTIGEHTISVTTLVSDKVPRGVFIEDGMSSFARNTKRIFDFFVATVTLLVFSPLMLICYIAIKMDDGGPAIYAQERIGRFGRVFRIYKFRSMRLDAEKMGPQLSAQQGQGDARLTKVGRFIRAHHLDELPQLWNVFCGDMSFIGPRPERKYFIDQIMEYDRRYTYLYQIRPGVTSYATLYNGYTDTMEKMLKRLEYDLYYLGNRSWWFDIKILWWTFYGIVSGKDI